ncbi:hypothetical protein E6W39_03610 [Kitasatospora acidiphila]|uniref:Uncharacterized protein n=1 Tax=Kitasatospora acidiphila TaxID=2567942 RepID=A0A540VXP8_9ACTN|nr:hypothetical protein [Kitasatospora acidiphila]TQF01497.1 hypothetical protein E6W39_03610 [Kitasatospora acidiphila]
MIHVTILTGDEWVCKMWPDSSTGAHQGRCRPNPRRWASTTRNGIITSERDFHRRQRRALPPAFRCDSIAACVGTMTDITEEQVSDWRPGEVIAVDLVMRRLMAAMLVATFRRAPHRWPVNSLSRQRFWTCWSNSGCLT